MFCLSFSFAWGIHKRHPHWDGGEGSPIADDSTARLLEWTSFMDGHDHECTHLPWTSSMICSLAHTACFLLPSAPASFLSVSCTSEHLVVGSPFTKHASMNSNGTPRSPHPFLLKSEVAMSKAFDDLIYKLTKSCCHGYSQKTVYQS